MKRTTLKIEDRLLRQLKQKAAAEGRTLQDLTNELLRRTLATPDRTAYALVLRGWKAELQPGVDIRERDALFDLMHGR